MDPTEFEFLNVLLSNNAQWAINAEAREPGFHSRQTRGQMPPVSLIRVLDVLFSP